MWLIGGDDDIAAGVEALDEEIKRASDRAAAVIAGSIVESFLTKLLVSNINDPSGKVWEARANPSGPFGTFATKIDLAYLMHMLTDEARRNLVLMKDVRNRFAHDLAIRSFEDSSIADRCRNLTLVDRYFREWTSEELMIIEEAQRTGDYSRMQEAIGDATQFIMGGIVEELRTPKGRYLWSARLFTFKLGVHVHNREKLMSGRVAI